MGQTVANGQPFIWMPGQLPYHVTDASKIKIYCPHRYRRVADRVQDNVPYFKEKMFLHPVGRKAAAVSNFLSMASIESSKAGMFTAAKG